MKLLYIYLTLLLLTSCGMTENLSKQCVGSDVEMGCNALLGSRDNEQDETVLSLIERIDALEKYNSVTKLSIASLQISVDILKQSAITNAADLLAIGARVTALEGQIGTPVIGLQSIVTNNTIQILQLQSNHNVTKLVDPCGNGPGYDEIFLRTATGKIIASFSDSASGLNTRFSELVAGGPYSTTDGTGCTFTVVTDVNGVLQIVSSPAAVEY